MEKKQQKCCEKGCKENAIAYFVEDSKLGFPLWGLWLCDKHKRGVRTE